MLTEIKKALLRGGSMKAICEDLCVDRKEVRQERDELFGLLSNPENLKELANSEIINIGDLNRFKLRSHRAKRLADIVQDEMFDGLDLGVAPHD